MRQLDTYTIPGNPVTLLAWCERCSRWHRHGRGDQPITARSFGWRTPHCEADGPPYELLNRGPADHSILLDAQRQRPLGPERLAVSIN